MSKKAKAKAKVDILKEKLILELWSEMEKPESWTIVVDNEIKQTNDFGAMVRFHVIRKDFKGPLDWFRWLFKTHGEIVMRHPVEWVIPKKYYVQFRKKHKQLRVQYKNYHDAKRIERFFAIKGEYYGN